ncbi:MAG: hypothetical protein V3T99_03580 [Nitrososphaerales archaeon]
MSRRYTKSEELAPKQRIQVFLDCVEELRRRPFILEGLYEFKFHIEADRETGEVRYSFNEISEEQFRSFLLTFRKFIMSNEPSNIDSVLNACIGAVYNGETEVLRLLKEFKAIWGYQYRTGVVQMKVEHRNLTPEYVLDLWLNGQYFHSRDIRKRSELKELLSHEFPTVKIQLLWSLPILTRTILRTGELVKRTLDEGKLDLENGL